MYTNLFFSSPFYMEMIERGPTGARMPVVDVLGAYLTVVLSSRRFSRPRIVLAVSQVASVGSTRCIVLLADCNHLVINIERALSVVPSMEQH